MAVRFYLPDAGTAPYTPTILSGWDQTAGWSSWPSDVVKGATPVGSGSARSKNTTVLANRLDRVYCSVGQLAAQTIPAGTFSAAIRAIESNAALDAWLQVIIRVVSADGTVSRGVIYGGSTATTPSATAGAENQEYGTASSSRIKNALTTSAVTAQSGDRIQIEIGARSSGGVTTDTFTHRYGDDSTQADFALTSGLTTNSVPWVELSQDLVWQTAVRSGSGSGSWGFTGSGTGVRPAKGSGTSTWRFTGSGSGGVGRGGSGAGTWRFTGSGVGKRPAKGTGASTWRFTGSGSGVTERTPPGPGTLITSRYTVVPTTLVWVEGRYLSLHRWREGRYYP